MRWSPQPALAHMPGTLFAARAGARLPGNQAVNGRFVEEWLDDWMRVGLTEPTQCELRFSATEGGDLSKGTYSWQFVLPYELEVLDSMTVETLIDVGWESADATIRAVAYRTRMHLNRQTDTAIFNLPEDPGQTSAQWNAAALG